MTQENKPLYLKIIDDIKARIMNEELKPEEKLPSEIDIAHTYGVSRITSKRAFEELEREGLIYRVRGSGSYVSSPCPGENCKDDANPNRAVVFDAILPFDSSLGRSMDLIRGANDYLQKNGCYLNILNSERSPQKEKDILLNLFHSGSSGMIYYPVSGGCNIDVVQMLIVNHFPIITVDKYFDGLPLESVVSDNFKGSYDAVSFLIEMGHRNIGYLSNIGLDAATSVRDRFFGYCSALKDNGIEIRQDNYILDYARDIRENHPEIEEQSIHDEKPFMPGVMDYYKKLLNGILDRRDGVTAVHTVNDYLAMYVLKAALSMGVRVPEDLSIVGYDNIEISRYLEVPITTVEQNFYQMGLAASKNLLRRLKSTKSGKINAGRTIIPTRLIKRDSVLAMMQPGPDAAGCERNEAYRKLI